MIKLGDPMTPCLKRHGQSRWVLRPSTAFFRVDSIDICCVQDVSMKQAPCVQLGDPHVARVKLGNQKPTSWVLASPRDKGITDRML